MQYIEGAADMTKKAVILGTAQLMEGYGQTNFSSLSIEEISSIFHYSFQQGILEVDTAPGYGESEKIIGLLDIQHEITTKIPTLVDRNHSYADWVECSVRQSLQYTKKKYIKNLLFHNTEDLIKNFSTELEKKLNYLKAENLVQNVGLSVYDVDELKSAMDLIHPSLIQFPLNPFDQRFLSSGILKELHFAGINTYARSIFMQGILISKKIRNAQYFQQWNDELNAWRDFCAKNNILPYEACIKFITDCNFLTGYTFGVSSLEELHQISEAIKLDVAVDCTNFASCDLNLIDPRQWP